MGVQTKAVYELSIEGCFDIPSFQRGYRWTDLQVLQLLDDIYDYVIESDVSVREKAQDGWYCLQPVFVSRDSQKGVISVIDGQQRLTTLFLLCRAIRLVAWKMSYETRAGSMEYLNKFDIKTWEKLSDNKKKQLEVASDENPDYHYIFRAWTCIVGWLNGKDLSALRTALKSCIKVIWYETDGNPYDEFIRLNSGKISLTNAELIKALILEGHDDISTTTIVGKWDRIEQTLRDDELWHFINPIPDASRYVGTRIDFLFELILRVDAAGVGEYKQWMCAPDALEGYIAKNPYYFYTVFEKFCRSHRARKKKQDQIWNEVEGVFSRILNWYSDRELYHLVGYSMNRKGDDVERKFSRLVEFIGYSKEHSKTRFKEYVRSCAWGSVKSIHNAAGDAVDEEKLCALSYLDSCDTCLLNDVLLLFNIGLLMYQRSEQSRYPFKTCRRTKWSLEHIHAKNERLLLLPDVRKIVYDTCGLSCGVGPAELNWTDEEWREKLGESWVQKCNEMLSAHGIAMVRANDKSPTSSRINLMEEVDERGDLVGWRISAVDEETHSIANLSLLDCRANAEFNNGLYWEKLAILSQWEVGSHKSIRAEYDEKKDFIPLGTRLTFFKHFSKHSTKSCREASGEGYGSVSFMWEPSDGKAYVDAIVQVLKGCYVTPDRRNAIGG